MLATTTISTAIGNLTLSANDTGLIACVFTQEKEIKTQHPILKEACKQLRLYTEKKLITFDVPLFLAGTDFQKKVWDALLTIPYGQTCSYQDIAEKIDNPNATRAVGNANGKNPLCIFIPCHRVIYASGKIGGYSGGLGYKEKLLALESRQ